MSAIRPLSLHNEPHSNHNLFVVDPRMEQSDVVLLQVKQQRRVTQRCAQLALGLALLLAIWKWNRIWASVMKSLPPARHAQREPIISPDISDIARKYMREGKVPGLSAGVVRLGVGIPDVEFGSWGMMSEDRADVTADVGPLLNRRRARSDDVIDTL